jgi:glycosyltransferase involved in cell wall biosynthesis
VSDTVRFTGWRRDATDIVEAADAYAHPSLWEGFGLALLEAMAAGKAVVASRVSTIPEIVIDGETGWLVAPRDGQALARALLRLLDDPVGSRQMGAAGCRRVLTRFDAERMVRATEAVYEEILPR